jgi:hypothetical protein
MSLPGALGNTKLRYSKTTATQGDCDPGPTAANRTPQTYAVVNVPLYKLRYGEKTVRRSAAKAEFVKGLSITELYNKAVDKGLVGSYYGMTWRNNITAQVIKNRKPNHGSGIQNHRRTYMANKAINPGGSEKNGKVIAYGATAPRDIWKN